MIIPVITLYQPWASFVIEGWKDIETRLHPRFAGLVGKTIGIHAGKKFDANHGSEQYLSAEQQEAFGETLWPMGAFLGTVFVKQFAELDKSHSKRALIECESVKRYGLFLTEPKPIEHPIVVAGSMGIWYFDTEKQIKVAKPQPVNVKELFRDIANGRD